MATITQRLEVCDVCRTVGLSVTRVRVAVGEGRLRSYALCEKDGGPLLRLVSTLTGSDTAVGRPAPRSRQVSMDQIEAVKTKRTPRKTSTPRRRPVKGT